MLFIVAADHTARGMVGVGADPRAMGDRRVLLERLLTALDHPRVDGVLASADIIEDLVLLDALDDRVAVGTMNRGGLAGAAWELDDRFTAYDTDHLVAANLDAGKMLLRIDGSDPGHRADAGGMCPGGPGAERPADDGDGRADPVHQGRQRRSGLGRRPDPAAQGGRRVRRARRLVGLHVAEDPGHGRHRRGGGDDHPTAAAPRRGARARPGGDVRGVGAGASPSPRSAGWSSAGRCCTRPTATSPRRSAGRPDLVERAAARR